MEKKVESSKAGSIPVRVANLFKRFVRVVDIPYKLRHEPKSASAVNVERGGGSAALP